MSLEPKNVWIDPDAMPPNTCDTASPSGEPDREALTSKVIVLRFLDRVTVTFIGITLLSLAGLPIESFSETLGMSVAEFRGFSMFVIFASLWLTHAIATSDSAP